jgi:myosin heavy subunit
VLDCLIKRFHQQKYCTFAGSVLIVLNPCSSDTARRHSLLNTYENKDVKKFVELISKNNNGDLELEPHVLSFGVKCLYNIGKVGNNQVIVVSGYVK